MRNYSNSEWDSVPSNALFDWLNRIIDANHRVRLPAGGDRNESIIVFYYGKRVFPFARDTKRNEGNFSRCLKLTVGTRIFFSGNFPRCFCVPQIRSYHNRTRRLRYNNESVLFRRCVIVGRQIRNRPNSRQLKSLFFHFFLCIWNTCDPYTKAWAVTPHYPPVKLGTPLQISGWTVSCPQHWFSTDQIVAI